MLLIFLIKYNKFQQCQFNYNEKKIIVTQIYLKIYFKIVFLFYNRFYKFYIIQTMIMIFKKI